MDNIDGGTDVDTFVLTGGAATNTLTINVATTTNQLSGIPGTTIANFEQFNLSSFAGLTTITGSDANDTLISGAGNDRITGGAGNDILTGNGGNDQLFGDAGDDILTGGVGGDRLTGGAGSDRFGFNAPTEGRDSIIDFSVADDTINVSKAGFGSGLSGNNLGTINPEHFTALGPATTPSHRFIYNSTGGLFYDSDGNGTAQVQLAVLSGNPAITYEDIFVIA